MPTTLLDRSASSLARFSERDVHALLDAARLVKQPGAAAGKRLLGRHAAVLSELPEGASAEAFTEAASALGAQVVRIPVGAAHLDDPRSRRNTARVLGRLYCALGCDGLGAGRASLLARWAGVPVFDAVASDTHPARLLGDLLTMCEHTHKPMHEITLGVAGEAQAPLAQAWQNLAELTGLHVRTGGAGRSDFICQAQAARDPGAPVALLAVQDGRAPRSLLAEQIENHRCMLQALLCEALI